MSTLSASPAARNKRHQTPKGFSLQIQIDGQNYLVQPLTVDPDAAQWCVRLTKIPCAAGREGEPDQQYHVSISPEGWWSCECMGWLRWSNCKHTKAMHALGREWKLPAIHPAPHGKGSAA